MKPYQLILYYRLRSAMLVLLGSAILFSCDVLESDPDVIVPDTHVDEADVVILANNTALIDLNTKIKTNVPAKIAITSEVKHGKMTDLGKGLVQYIPQVGSKKAVDRFEVTMYAQNNDILKRDTIVIRIENDTTNLPCNIYAVTDYVYGVTGQTRSVLIDVTDNDIICGGPVRLSIYKPDNSFPPVIGTAEVVENAIRYTPAFNYNGKDAIIYRLSAVSDTSRYAYGIVFISGDSLCSSIAKDDHFTFSESSVDSTLLLPVFKNDSLCAAIDQYQVTIKTQPQRGQVLVVQGGISYKANLPVSIPFTDEFIYEVCKDGTCSSANVNVMLKKDSTCRLVARPDIIHFSADTATVVNIDVIINDTICGDLKSLTIVQQPTYGSATIYGRSILYEVNPAYKKDDSFEYEICDEGECKRTTVAINVID